MNHRPDNTSQHKSQQDQLPSKDQTTGKHQLNVTPADRSAAAHQIKNLQHTADTDHPNQMLHQIPPVKHSHGNTKDKQKHINSKRNLISPPVNHTQNQKSRRHQAIDQAETVQTINCTDQYIDKPVHCFDHRILRRNRRATVTTLSSKHQPAKHRNHIIPLKLLPTGHAMRRCRHNGLMQRNPVNTDI